MNLWVIVGFLGVIVNRPPSRSQQIIQKVHTLDFLLQIGAAINIERKRHIFMPQDFRQRFNIKVGNFDCSDCKSVPYFMEFHLWKVIPLEEPGEILPVCPWLGWPALAREKILRGVIGYVLPYYIREQRRKRNGAN